MLDISEFYSWKHHTVFLSDLRYESDLELYSTYFAPNLSYFSSYNPPMSKDRFCRSEETNYKILTDILDTSAKFEII